MIDRVKADTAEQKGSSCSFQTNTNKKNLSQHNTPPTHYWHHLCVSLLTINLDAKLYYLHTVFRECACAVVLLLLNSQLLFSLCFGELEDARTPKTPSNRFDFVIMSKVRIMLMLKNHTDDKQHRDIRQV